ncbi:hypothetical protein GEOBC_01410 [Geobacteraceae bacterium]|nr:hypothetical protein GEOBC_01410 [Geobacteraceae bacterium]
MNAKSILATVAAALVGTSVYAIEATQLEVPPSTFNREQVKLQLLDAPTGTSVVSYGEATVFVDAAGTGRSREDVRAEAKAAPSHSGMKDCPYVGG